MTVTQYMPFFLTALIPTLAILIGILVNKSDAADMKAQMRTDFSDVKNQITHLVDLHIHQEGRLSSVEERTKKL
jgi:hypothetical protein